MKKNVFSLIAGSMILFSVACKDTEEEAMTTDETTGTSMDESADMSSSVQTSPGGRNYVLRQRVGSSSTGTTAGASNYDTVWLYSGSQNRYYTLRGPQGSDTLYFNTEEWRTWWTNPETDNELKLKGDGVKLKVDDDGSYKIKTDTSKTKVNEEGKVKNKPKGEKS